MDKKVVIAVVAFILVVALGSLFFIFKPRQAPTQSPFYSSQNIKSQKLPSSTLKNYTDASGFSFSYPNDLSLVKNDIKDDLTYADIDIRTSQVQGGLKIKITDTKVTSLSDWVKNNSGQSKEVMLGNLKATQIEDGDKLLLGAIDQGVLFSIEVSYGGEKDFWKEAYIDIISTFNFSAQASSEGASAGDGAVAGDVSFEGEEVIE